MAELTGVGRYRDVLAMADGGSGCDRGLRRRRGSSTAVTTAEFEPALRWILGRLAEIEPDVVAAEAGASPLEPYGEAAVRLLGDAGDARCCVRPTPTRSSG